MGERGARAWPFSLAGATGQRVEALTWLTVL